MARISLQNVSKSFGGDQGPWAVKDFCLEIEDGELVVLSVLRDAENRRHCG